MLSAHRLDFRFMFCKYIIIPVTSKASILCRPLLKSRAYRIYEKPTRNIVLVVDSTARRGLPMLRGLSVEYCYLHVGLQASIEPTHSSKVLHPAKPGECNLHTDTGMYTSIYMCMFYSTPMLNFDSVAGAGSAESIDMSALPVLHPASLRFYRRAWFTGLFHEDILLGLSFGDFFMRTRTSAYARAYTGTDTITHTYTDTYACTCAYTYACTYAYTDTYTCTRTYPYAHTYTYTCTCIYMYI